MWAWEAQDDMEAADREGLQRVEVLMIVIIGDLVWDLPCLQQASYLEGYPLMWILPLYQHVNKKSDDDNKLSICAILDLWLMKVKKFDKK